MTFLINSLAPSERYSRTQKSKFKITIGQAMSLLKQTCGKKSFLPSQTNPLFRFQAMVADCPMWGIGDYNSSNSFPNHSTGPKTCWRPHWKGKKTFHLKRCIWAAQWIKWLFFSFPTSNVKLMTNNQSEKTVKLFFFFWTAKKVKDPLIFGIWSVC